MGSPAQPGFIDRHQTRASSSSWHSHCVYWRVVPLTQIPRMCTKATLERADHIPIENSHASHLSHRTLVKKQKSAATRIYHVILGITDQDFSHPSGFRDKAPLRDDTWWWWWWSAARSLDRDYIYAQSALASWNCETTTSPRSPSTRSRRTYGTETWYSLRGEIHIAVYATKATEAGE